LLQYNPVQIHGGTDVLEYENYLWYLFNENIHPKLSMIKAHLAGATNWLDDREQLAQVIVDKIKFKYQFIKMLEITNVGK
jgi:hypothetical protein